LSAAETFALATIDELWLAGTPVESRLAHGRARMNGSVIDADDARDDALVARCERAVDPLRSVARELTDARVRLVVRASTGGDSATMDSGTMSVTIAGVSLVTDVDHADADVALLRRFAAMPVTREAPPGAALVWRNGSGAVLLHEAIGHAVEHGHAPLEWPSWLRADIPLAPRRASFSDVPLPRMTAVNISQIGAPFELPPDAVEVQLIAGGRYEPLTELVTLDVALATIGGERVAPFTIRLSRAEVPGRVVGAAGEAERYPGVVCSREGQELVVGSFAPVMVTR
jgi:hypothetical protein